VSLVSVVNIFAALWMYVLLIIKHDVSPQTLELVPWKLQVPVSALDERLDAHGKMAGINAFGITTIMLRSLRI
jgi:hypothetical protein